MQVRWFILTLSLLGTVRSGAAQSAHARPDPIQVLQAGQAAVGSARTVRFDVHVALSDGTDQHGRLALARIEGRTMANLVGYGRESDTPASESSRRTDLVRSMDLMRRTRVVRIHAQVRDTLTGIYDGAQSAVLTPARRDMIVDTTGAGVLSVRGEGLMTAMHWFESPSTFAFNASIESALVRFADADTVGGVICDVIEIEPFANLPQALEAGYRNVMRVSIGRGDHFPRRIEQRVATRERSSWRVITITRLEANPQLDPDTFTVRVPAGYTVHYETPPPLVWPPAPGQQGRR